MAEKDTVCPEDLLVCVGKHAVDMLMLETPSINAIHFLFCSTYHWTNIHHIHCVAFFPIISESVNLLRMKRTEHLG